FGYGEVCWRDFEAICTGSLVFKQDMSHTVCSPDIFIPYETYVPLAFDLSDFDEKLNYYLLNEEERVRITRNAFNRLHNYFINDDFLYDMRPLLKRLDL
ncbi:MAG: glycosyltransferase, partial [Methylococcales bacterium]